MSSSITTSDIYNTIYGMSDKESNIRSKAGLNTKGEVLDYLSNPGYSGASTSKINPNTTAKALDNSRFFKMNINMAKGKEINNGKLASSNEYNATLNPMQLVDFQWITSRFMAPTNSLIDIDRKNRFFSTARYKAQSTKMGCHLSMNPRPQFTRFADIKGNNHKLEGISTAKGEYDPTFSPVTIEYPKTFNNQTLDKIGLGMGRYYSEAIDDNATTIFLEFGVPKFNSILGFLTRAVSLNDQIMASTGRYISNNIGSALGTFIGFCAFPLIGTLLFVAKTVSGFLSNQPFSYYYLAPTMHTYWSSVSNILSQIMVEMGFINPRLLGSSSIDTKFQDMIGVPMKIHKEDMAGIAQYFPKGFIRATTDSSDNFLGDSNYIDVFAVAGYQQRIAYEQSQQLYNYFSSGDGSKDENMTEGDLFTRLSGYVQYGEYGEISSDGSNIKSLGNSNIFSTLNAKVSLGHLLRTVFGNKNSKDEELANQSYFKRNLDAKTLKSTDNITYDGKEYSSDTTEIASSSTTSLSSSDADSTALLSDSISNDVDTVGVKDHWSALSFAQSYADQWDSVLRDGTKWAILNVDYNGEQSDSFSNSYSDIDIGVGVKSVSSAARTTAFNVAGGNVIPGLDNIVNGIKDFAMGVVDGATFGLGGVLASVFNGAFIDLPKKWDDSSISISSTSYSIDLVSPYGNPFSQIQNIYLPLSMLLAGCLPLYAGEAAYVSPFLCSVFNKGVQMVRLGMITSLSITRGTGNLGFNKSKRPLAFKVSFTISDFSNIMTAPINASIGSSFRAMFRSDSKFSDYVGLLVARDLYTHTYFKPKALMRLSLLMMGVSQIISPYQWATRMSGSIVNSILSVMVSPRIISLSQYNAKSTIMQKQVANNVSNDIYNISDGLY